MQTIYILVDERSHGRKWTTDKDLAETHVENCGMQGAACTMYRASVPDGLTKDETKLHVRGLDLATLSIVCQSEV